MPPIWRRFWLLMRPNLLFAVTGGKSDIAISNQLHDQADHVPFS